MSFAGRPQGTNPVMPGTPQTRPQQLGAALQMPAQGGLSAQSQGSPAVMPMNPAQASPAVMPMSPSPAQPQMPQMPQVMQNFTPPQSLGAGGGGPGAPPGQTPPIMAPGQMPPQPRPMAPPMPPQGMNGGDPRQGMGGGQMMQQFMQNHPNFRMPGNFQPGQMQRPQMPQQFQQGQFRQPGTSPIFGMGSRNRIT